MGLNLKGKLAKFFGVRELKKYDTPEEVKAALTGKDSKMDQATKAAVLLCLALGLQAVADMLTKGITDPKELAAHGIAAVVSGIVAWLTHSPIKPKE